MAKWLMANEVHSESRLYKLPSIESDFTMKHTQKVKKKAISSSLEELFCEVDDFCRAFISDRSQ